MLDFLANFASATVDSAEESTDLLGSLGVDWQMLILQMISFVALVLFVAKFIYPQIVGMLDRRDKIIDESMKAARESQKRSDEAEAEISKMLENARKEAGDIVTTAKKESSGIVASAESDAIKRADVIVANAKVEIDREVENARKALRNEVVDLVSTATEKVVEAKINDNDKNIIKNAIKERK